MAKSYTWPCLGLALATWVATGCFQGVPEGDASDFVVDGGGGAVSPLDGGTIGEPDDGGPPVSCGSGGWVLIDTFWSSPEYKGCTSLWGDLKVIQVLTLSLPRRILHPAQLSRLREIDGSLTMDAVLNLKDLEELRSLQSASGGIYIYNTRQLESLRGLRSLRTPSKLPSLVVQTGSSAMRDLDGLQGITDVGELLINGGGALETLHGLENLRHVDSLTISWNDNLRSLAALENLERANTVSILHNDRLPRSEVEAFLARVPHEKAEAYANGP